MTQSESLVKNLTSGGPEANTETIRIGMLLMVVGALFIITGILAVRAHFPSGGFFLLFAGLILVLVALIVFIRAMRRYG